MAESKEKSAIPYDKDAALERSKERTAELTDKLEQGMKNLYNSDKYKDYLKAMSVFHNYSSKNIMLIKVQMPEATQVASFKLWKEKWGRQVKKGQKGLYVYAPIVHKIKEERQKVDKETGAPMLDKSGKAVMEEIEMQSLPKFKLVPIFDISQTHGDPLPELVENLTGSVAQYDVFLDTLKAVSPLSIEFGKLPESTDGQCYFGEKIVVREGMSEPQTISAIVHEIAHAKLHNINNEHENSEKPPKIKSADMK